PGGLSPGPRREWAAPAVVITAGFGLAVLIGTLLLGTPLATTEGDSSHWLTALFTATSAVCVTGLVVVDTETHWSVFGEVVIVLLIQVGGLGIMTLATLILVIVSGRVGLRARLSAQLETKSVVAADLRHVLRKVVTFSLICEVAIAAVLAVRFITGYGEPLGRAVYLGVFHGVSAFNNAGFALWPDNLMRFVTDPWICLTIALAVIVGGLGYPVVFELLRTWRYPRRWSVLTRITVGVSALLLAAGTLTFLMTEWRNPATMGPLDDSGKLLAAFFAAVMPRSGGFNTLDIGQMYPSSWLVTDVLMFIGGGSAGTAGRHQGHHVRLPALHHLVRTARRASGQHRPSAAALRDATAGIVHQPARRHPGRDLHLAAAHHHTTQPRPGAVRGDLGLRHQRPVHRHHRPHLAGRTRAAQCADVHRPHRPAHPGLGARAETTHPPLRTTGGKSDRWLTQGPRRLGAHRRPVEAYAARKPPQAPWAGASSTVQTVVDTLSVGVPGSLVGEFLSSFPSEAS
ncbi:TrkH family potassium uptake protein, partial [Nonomuraea rubra]|uniref:TrkH family potassium uptake protein n=1 Tax=Nonomuraea rubra TaxID=46180 RepID=UPI003CD07441